MFSTKNSIRQVPNQVAAVVSVMPTGGVTAENLAAFLAAGAIAVGAGGDLLAKDALASGDWDRLEARARDYAAALQAARLS